jgi:hypothetical protein
MPIGMSSLIPLNQVQADPNARFQRFGLNSSQLFGKPLDFAPQAQPSQLAKITPRRAETPNLAQRSQDREPGPTTEQRPAVASGTPILAPGYSGRPEGSSGTGTAPKLGSFLNLKG